MQGIIDGYIGDITTTETPVTKEWVELLDWTKRYRAMLDPKTPLNFSDHVYLKPIYKDKNQQIDICKSGQSGLSEYLLSWVLWSVAERRANGLYILPTDGDVSDFSASRLGPAIEPEASPLLAAMIGERGGDRKAVDNVSLKRVGDAFLYLRPGTVKKDGRANRLKTMSVDVLALDEFDEIDARAPALAEERLKHSKIAEIRRVSTPTYLGTGIYARFLQSDMRLWFIKCGACSNRQDLTIDDLITERDAADRPVNWHGKSDGNPHLACRKCGKALNRLSPGEWIATSPGRVVHGYHISRLFTTHVDLMDIIDGLRSTDETKRQQTYNQALALPYNPPDAITITDSILNGCRRDYRLGSKPKTRKVYAGIDVGAVLNIVIREKVENGILKALYIGEVSDFSEAESLLKRFKVSRCVIDALPETRKARELQKSFKGRRLWLAYYVSGVKGTKKQEFADWDIKDGIVNVDRTRSLDDSRNQFIISSDDAESEGVTLPAGADRIPNYYSQIKALIRVIRTNRDGDRVPVYEKSGADHYGHAENYCNVAASSPIGTFLG